jgi:hypothetical protein
MLLLRYGDFFLRLIMALPRVATGVYGWDSYKKPPVPYGGGGTSTNRMYMQMP